MRPVHLFLLILSTALLGCAIMATAKPNPSDHQSDLRDLGPAPELTNTVWLNTDAPLRLADLRGKVVAIDMWTFG